MKNFVNNPDPILTKLGHTQASETGQFLKQQLSEIEAQEGRKFDRIVVNSSPFIRTIASSARVC